MDKLKWKNFNWGSEKYINTEGKGGKEKEL